MLPFDYRCPIDYRELYEELYRKPIDMPPNVVDGLLAVHKNRTIEMCIEKWGLDSVHVSWGIFMGVA